MLRRDRLKQRHREQDSYLVRIRSYLKQSALVAALS